MSVVRSAGVAQHVGARSQEVAESEESIESIVLSLIANSESLTDAWSFTNGRTAALADQLISQAAEASSLLRLVIDRERQLAQKVEQLHRELECARADAIRLHASISWRITRPLRAISRRIFGARAPSS